VRFQLRQRFTASVDDVEAAYLDAELLARLDGLPSLGRPELLDQAESESGDTVRQRVRYRFTGRLSAAVTAVVDPARLTWVQESLIDRRTHRADINILPDHYPDRLRCEGTITLREIDGNGCERLTEGDLRVRFPMVASRVERAIVGGLQEHASAEVAIVEQWLKERDPR
jgi:hypothetical protein